MAIDLSMLRASALREPLLFQFERRTKQPGFDVRNVGLGASSQIHQRFAQRFEGERAEERLNKKKFLQINKAKQLAAARSRSYRPLSQSTSPLFEAPALRGHQPTVRSGFRDYNPGGLFNAR